MSKTWNGLNSRLTFLNSKPSSIVPNLFYMFSYTNDREGNGTPLQYFCLENPMDGGAWKAAVHGVSRSWTRLSDFTFTFHFHALEKEMATHSSVLAWRIPGTGEPGGLPSLGSHRVGHDWSDFAAAAEEKGMESRRMIRSKPRSVQKLDVSVTTKDSMCQDSPWGTSLVMVMV